MTRFARLIAMVALVVNFPLAVGAIAQEHSRPRVVRSEHGDEAVHDEIHHAMEAGEDYVVESQRENLLIWFIGALGWRYVLLLPMSALFAFVAVAILLARGKGSHTGAAAAFVVAIPFMIGLFAMFDGMIASFMVVAHSSVSPKPSEIAVGVSTSLVAPITALFLMVPSYLLATVGLSIRALRGDSKS